MWLLVLEVGWGLVGAALLTVEEALDPISVGIALLIAGLGLGALIPGGFFAVRDVRRDREARRLFVQWAALDHAPERDARHRAPGLSVTWLLVSFALCAAGLWLCFAVPASARPGTTTYAQVACATGAGLLLWVNGLAGLAKAIGHYRFAVRFFSSAQVGPPASSARPPHV